MASDPEGEDRGIEWQSPVEVNLILADSIARAASQTMISPARPTSTPSPAEMRSNSGTGAKCRTTVVEVSAG